MGAEESEIAALRRLGLTEYESRLYLALLKMGPIKASQLSFFGQVPRTKTYYAIKELQRKGLVTITPGKPELYAPRSPLEILMPIVTRLDHDIKDSEQVVQTLAMTYESSKYVRRNVPKQSDQFWQMEGRQSIYNKLNQLMKDASRSINYSTTAPGLIRAYKVHANALEHAAKNGVTVKLLAPVTTENSSLVTQFSEIADFKATLEPLASFVCVDSKELVVLDSKPDDVRTDQGSDVAVWTTSRLLVELFDKLFDEVWRNKPEKKIR
ncbi:MAG: helix-turn-helix domain-containing protein [Candidatus Bathyarchaeia archaeon]